MTMPRTRGATPPHPTDFGGGSQLRSRRLPKRLWKRPTIRLPPLTTDEAILAIEVLERIVQGIWRANGDGIADFMGSVDPETMYSWCDEDEPEPPDPGGPASPDF